MFCKYLKLSNGDNIIVTTDTDCKNFKQFKTIFVYDPVILNNVQLSQGPFLVDTFTMQPWIRVAKNDIIEIPTDSIIVAVDLHESAIDQYKKFVLEYSSTETNIQEATDEEIDSVFESLNEQEEDEPVELPSRRRTSRGKTVH